MKKFFALLLSLCFVVSLSACGGSGSSGNAGSAYAKSDELDASATLEVDIQDAWSSIEKIAVSQIDHVDSHGPGCTAAPCRSFDMACDCICCKERLSADDIAIFRKMVCREARQYLCMTCLAGEFGVPRKRLEDMADFYHRTGVCSLFPKFEGEPQKPSL